MHDTIGHVSFEDAFGYADLPTILKGDGSHYRHVIHKTGERGQQPTYVWYGGIPHVPGHPFAAMVEGVSARVYRKRCLPALSNGKAATLEDAKRAVRHARMVAERIGYYCPKRGEQAGWTAEVFHPNDHASLKPIRLTWSAMELPKSLLHMRVYDGNTPWIDMFERLDARSALASENLIKGRDRVKQAAEVLTPKDLVEDMLNALEPSTSDPEKRLLEPACGDGNFLIAVLQRRLHKVFDLYGRDPNNQCFGILVALSNIYGIDIAEDNVLETQTRLRTEVERWARPPASKRDGFWKSVDAILVSNIQAGDFLHPEGRFFFLSFDVPKPLHFTVSTWHFSDVFPSSNLETSDPAPISQLKAQPYWKMTWPDWTEFLLKKRKTP